MKIVIEYDSSWRNSFTSDNPKYPGKKIFTSSSTALRDDANFRYTPPGHNTIMGILNRVIGDYRRLFDARKSDDYYFADIEPHVSFKDAGLETQEIVFLRNLNQSFDQNDYAGIIDTTHPLFSSVWSSALWSIIDLDFDQLCAYICDQSTLTATDQDYDPLYIAARFAEVGKQKTAAEMLERELKYLALHFPDQNYVDKKGRVFHPGFYASALYMRLNDLQAKYDVSPGLTTRGFLPGISKRSFTAKDFFSSFASGKKPVYGNPYVIERKVKGLGSVKKMLAKASGELIVNLDISDCKAAELSQLIVNAGVADFELGKKGAAYISEIKF